MEASRVDEIIRRWDLLRGEAHALHKQVVELRAQLSQVEADARAQIHALAVAKGQIDRRLRRANAESSALSRNPIVKLLRRLTRGTSRPLPADEGTQDAAASHASASMLPVATIDAVLSEARPGRAVVLLVCQDPARAAKAARELATEDLMVVSLAPGVVEGTLTLPPELPPAQMDRILGAPGVMRAFVVLGPSLHASRWFTSAQAIGWLGVACFEEEDLAADDDGAGAFILRNADVVVTEEGSSVVEVAGPSIPTRSTIRGALTVSPWSPVHRLVGPPG